MSASPARVHRLKWTWLPEVRHVHDMTVGIVASDEPPSPEYVVVILGTDDGFTEAARCDRFAPGALARMTAAAELIADTLETAQCTWLADVEPHPPDRPG